MDVLLELTKVIRSMVNFTHVNKFKDYLEKEV